MLGDICFHERAILRAKLASGHIKIVHFGEKGTVHLVQNAEVIKKIEIILAIFLNAC